MLKHHMAVVCAVTASCFSTPALSQSPVEIQGHRIDPAHQRIVRYGDLNLSTATGEAKLMSRIRFAVRDLCVEGVNYSPKDAADLRSCKSRAWGSARPQLDQLLAEARTASVGSAGRTAMTISIAGALGD